MPKNPYLKSETKERFDDHLSRAVMLGFVPILGYIAIRSGQNPLIWVDRVNNLGEPFSMAKIQVDGLGDLGKKFEASGFNELAQVLNVRARSMSFVGPRPLLDDEMHHFKKSLRKTVRKEWEAEVEGAVPGIFSSYAYAWHRGSTARDRALMDIYDAKHASINNDWVMVKRAIGLGKKATENYNRNLTLKTTKKAKSKPKIIAISDMPVQSDDIIILPPPRLHDESLHNEEAICLPFPSPAEEVVSTVH